MYPMGGWRNEEWDFDRATNLTKWPPETDAGRLQCNSDVFRPNFNHNRVIVVLENSEHEK